jgi:hypothetical protein
MPYRCPQCHESHALWQEIQISGWQSLNDQLGPTGEREADWTFIDELGNYGCGQCDWEGRRDQIEKVGHDGQPLPFIHDGQLALEEEDAV